MLWFRLVLQRKKSNVAEISDAMGRDANIVLDKAALRAIMMARRRSIPEKSRLEMSRVIAGYVMGMPEVVKAHHVSLYLTIASHAEVFTAPIFEALAGMEKRLSVPVIRDGDLFSVAFHHGDALRRSPFALWEPENIQMVGEADLDIVLLPLLAVDARGFRLGYGKGFYDRFLERLSAGGFHPFRIGLSFTQQMVDEIAVDPWDEPLDAVVHEGGVLRFT